ncbi:MAG: hypothetical protein ACXV3C_04120 [Actinomycetes bacterium]
MQTSSPAVTTSSPTPSATPVEAQVEAAVRAYYAELTRAVRTSDSRGLKDLMSKGCPCYQSVHIVDDNKRRGRSGPGANIDVKSVKIHDVIAQSAGAVVAYRVRAYDLVDNGGRSVLHIKARDYRVDLSFIAKDEEWILTNSFNLAA